MTHHYARLTAAVALATITAAACVYEAGIARADDATDGVTRVELQRVPAPTPGFEIVQTRVEIPVDERSGRHSHPGPEIGYIVAGDVDIVFDDRVTEHLHTGVPFRIPTGVIHDAINVGAVPTMMLSTYVIPEGQPLVEPH
jgi:quercetin dioxygenase-like cupin family protein